MIINASDKNSHSEIIRKAIAILQRIGRSERDNLVCNHLILLLEEQDARQTETEQLLCSLVSLILGAFSVHLDPESTLFTQIKLLQYRLASPITYAELVALQHYVESCADQITQSEEATRETIEATLKPIIDSFGLGNGEAFGKAAKPVNGTNDKPDYNKVSKNGPESFSIQEFEHLLQDIITDGRLAGSIEQSKAFDMLLEHELAALNAIDDQQAFADKKQVVLAELEKILHSHRQLTRYFQTMSGFISSLQQDSIRLMKELDRVTLLSMTDELTGLPNRRAFLKHLEDEIARVKRYGHDLSIALLDIDHFKPINDQYGHNAGDMVLKCYAKSVLSIFRQQDIVARYGGEEFVVIFPDTDLDGAYNALKKVQKRAEEMSAELENESIALPSFSAGLVEYRDDPSIDSLIHRADMVLYAAKARGRNRIEVERSASFFQ